MPERSYSDRSAVEMNFSAASSLSSLGSFFLIVRDLLRVHVPGADRSNEVLPCAMPKRKHDDHAATVVRPADSLEPLLVSRMGRIAIHRDRPVKQCLDGRNRYAVLPAFFAVPCIPVEAGNERPRAIL